MLSMHTALLLSRSVMGGLFNYSSCSIRKKRGQLVLWVVMKKPTRKNMLLISLLCSHRALRNIPTPKTSGLSCLFSQQDLRFPTCFFSVAAFAGSFPSVHSLWLPPAHTSHASLSLHLSSFSSLAIWATKSWKHLRPICATSVSAYCLAFHVAKYC